MKNEIEQIAQQNDMSIEFVTWFFNEKKVGCGNVWFMMMAAMWEGWKGRSIEMDKLAAENVALKSAVDHTIEWIESTNGDPCDVVILKGIRTPATDRIVAEAEARGVEKGIAHLEKKFSNIGVQIMNLQWLADSLREGASE
ncbi:hypothetical protein GJJ09_20645 [Klebsiella pneumoniae]|nr:hypothetical protein D1637_14270 [Klebsiella pneumoniae]KEG34223.1 hypothetical protein EQ82_08715 [Klebsiella pneumoniae]MRJ68605.1 hypothetical protein [Klebsiella pneumoniae]TYZ22860.1 hypothetical protein FCH11_011735 [Klebsiella pneumoniae]VEC04823.1 Uncharacterised protein [Klebsiella pneumoniae]